MRIISYMDYLALRSLLRLLNSYIKNIDIRSFTLFNTSLVIYIVFISIIYNPIKP